MQNTQTTKSKFLLKCYSLSRFSLQHNTLSHTNVYWRRYKIETVLCCELWLLRATEEYTCHVYYNATPLQMCDEQCVMCLCMMHVLCENYVRRRNWIFRQKLLFLFFSIFFLVSIERFTFSPFDYLLSYMYIRSTTRCDILYTQILWLFTINSVFQCEAFD